MIGIEGDVGVFVDCWCDPCPTVELAEFRTVPERFKLDLFGSLVRGVAGVAVCDVAFVAVNVNCVPLIPDGESMSMDSG